MRWLGELGAAFSILVGVHAASAAVTEQEAKRLEGDLTPYGAERAGNAAGTIPAWDGGLSAPPEGIGYQPGEHHPDPFAADKPLFTITSATMAQYDAQLTNGHKELLKAYPETYKMNVYPTRRSCAYPPHVYQAVARNAVNGKMINDGNSITGATMAPPFPIPQSAREIVWNHELNYRGFKTLRGSAGAAPSRGGDFTPEISIDRNMYNWSDPANTTTESLGNIVYYYVRETLSPPQVAGTVFLLHYTLDQIAEDRHTWNYKPGERKVKRLTGLQYDTPTGGSDGIRTVDNFQLWNGGADRYTWEQQGKSEKIIAYNTYRFASPDLQYKDILQKGHLNTDPIRYELHRVWEVEAKLAPGKAHGIVHRRKFYLDEDTWIIGATALYGADDTIARAQEGFIYNYYEHPICLAGTDAIYDVKGGVYHILGMRNQEKEVDFNADHKRENFTTEAIRRTGVR